MKDKNLIISLFILLIFTIYTNNVQASTVQFQPKSFESLKNKFNESGDEIERMAIIKEIWNLGAINADEVMFFKKLLKSNNFIIKYYSALALWSQEKFLNNYNLGNLNQYIVEMLRNKNFDFLQDFRKALFTKEGNNRDLLYILIKLSKDYKETIEFRKKIITTLNIMAQYYSKHGYKQLVKFINSAIVSAAIDSNEDLSMVSAFILDQNEDVYGKSNRNLTTHIFNRLLASENIDDEKRADIAFSFYTKRIDDKENSNKFLDVLVEMLNDKRTDENLRYKIAYKLSELPISYLTIPYLIDIAHNRSDQKMQEYAALHLTSMLHDVHLRHDGVNFENKDIIVDDMHDKVFPTIAKLLKSPYQGVRRYSFKFFKNISSPIINKKNSELKKMLKNDDIRIVERAKAALLIKKFDRNKLKSVLEVIKNVPIPSQPALSPPPPPAPPPNQFFD